ncbi:hypothetical protein ACFFX0_17530 [Citricoccus parietis]|uniref:Uncharacterized protein n=1 Tax=Citricoccus parietis TaxID=592307 RepID=A0ABV5G2L8_9MICC
MFRRPCSPTWVASRSCRSSRSRPPWVDVHTQGRCPHWGQPVSVHRPVIRRQGTDYCVSARSA